MISRNGDLVHQVFLQLELPAVTGATVSGTNVTGAAYTEHVGHAVIKSVQVEIGGQPIDKHYGAWLEIWNELTQTAEKVDGYNEMVGSETTADLEAESGVSQILYIPMQFWFKLFEPKSNTSYICGQYISKTVELPHLTPITNC